MANKKVDPLISRESKTAGSEELLSIAINIMCETEDKAWAGGMFQSALAQADNHYDPRGIMQRIATEVVDFTCDYKMATVAINDRLKRPNISLNDQLRLAEHS